MKIIDQEVMMGMQMGRAILAREVKQLKSEGYKTVRVSPIQPDDRFCLVVDSTYLFFYKKRSRRWIFDGARRLQW